MQYSALVNFAETLSASKDMESLLLFTVYTAKELTKANSGMIFLKENDEFVLRAYADIENTHISYDEIKSQGDKDTLFIPLKVSQNHIIGKLVLKGVFSEEDKLTADFIALQCTIAILVTRYEAIDLNKNSIAHDIKNILGVINIYASLIEENTENKIIKDYINSIQMEIERAQNLASNLMENLEKDTILHYESFLVTKLCDDIAKTFNASSSMLNINVVVKYDKPIIMNADKYKLHRVIFNLINNAIQAIGENGNVIINVREHNKYVTIAVCDNGKGISKNAIPHLFDPYQTSGKTKGTGLGLLIVKNIINAHNGTIRVRSEKGRYTVFSIRIPKLRQL